MTEEQLAAFELGEEDFAEVEEADEGLGPVFNNTGCGVCHDQPVTGGASTTNLVEIRYGKTNADGSFDPLSQFGGSLQQLAGIGNSGIPGCEAVNFAQETIPPEANTLGGRLTQPLFGLGLIDGIPDSSFHTLAALQAALFPSTAGRVSIVTNIATGQPDVGRFGWKAVVASVFDFSGDAYLNEMGITNPLFPNESCFNGDCALTAQCDPTPDPEDDGTALENFTNFMTFLAPLPTGPTNAQTVIGAGAFAAIGCANCHVPIAKTGSSTIPALDRKTFNPYSDFLLHDMGSLGDGIVQGSVGAREMRTAPLWGARVRTAFLHDGRAASVRDAILAHAGQGQSARDQFAGLPGFLRNAVVAFVNSL
ncbi:MAG TPA: di-heme oxidoredictase family protein [Kofleriaceae bacterium]|nr:di-heme oxidoredictase family protein [Kofleriaceae bacterium]